MDIGNVQIPSRDECRRRNLCFKCGNPNQRSAQCNHRRTHNDRGKNHSGRNNQQHVNRQHINNLDSREDEQKRIIYDRVTINAVEAQKKTKVEHSGLESSSSGSEKPSQSRLSVRDGVIGDKSVKILIDSGASTNLIKPGLASKVLSVQKVQARRFGGNEHRVSPQREWRIPFVWKVWSSQRCTLRNEAYRIHMT
uniref:Uncharacterized protein AlNc14C507G11974 n=1 Tax=Albugo laibachii Nc14 TaxID=890382 RepID=F0X0M8_9STRA|nr:hypothetical protein PITG_05996 [Albugo laibachii Nc14]|eukprot:CCA27321.1 hypothetical protein PITG_05996 [Albugo laibachii Nc14]